MTEGVCFINDNNPVLQIAVGEHKFYKMSLTNVFPSLFFLATTVNFPSINLPLAAWIGECHYGVRISYTYKHSRVHTVHIN